MIFVDTIDFLKVKETHDRAIEYMYLHVKSKYFDSKNDQKYPSFHLTMAIKCNLMLFSFLYG